MIVRVIRWQNDSGNFFRSTPSVNIVNRFTILFIYSVFGNSVNFYLAHRGAAFWLSITLFLIYDRTVQAKRLLLCKYLNVLYSNFCKLIIIP